jgi:glycosyltransferase involved in cell wall biosynthesis/ubiquinone/menaquinone biosynthesis C-methylase UbiE
MLEWTGERYLPYIDPSICGAEIHYEHLHRYAFTSQYVKGKKVLDLASGEGYGSFLLSQNAESVIGIDIDTDTVKHASTRYNKDNLTFLQGSIIKIPIAGEKLFDVIVCFEAIEHIKEHEILLQEIKRLIKDDGILIISTPNKKTYSDDDNYKNPYHLKELYYSEFYELLKKNFGFIYLSGQRVISGSSIYPVSSHETITSFSEFDIKLDNGHFSFSSDEEEVPRYFIAIASNSNLNTEQMQRSYLIDKSNAEISLFFNQVTHLNQILESQNQQVLEMSLNIQSLEQASAAKDEQLANMSLNIQSLEQASAAKDEQLAELSLNIQDLTTRLNDREQKLSSIEQSIIWQFTMKFHSKVIERLLPQNTRRRRYYDLGIAGGKILVNEGWNSFWYKVNERKFHKMHLEKNVFVLPENQYFIHQTEVIDTIDIGISIIIPTKNAGQDFEFVLEKIKNQKGIKNIEIVIVDSGSTDTTLEIAKKYQCKIFSIRPEDFNHGLTRNYGAQQASGEVIVFLVQDAIPIGEYWLYNLVQPLLKDPKIAGITCRQVPRSDADLFAGFMLWKNYKSLQRTQDEVYTCTHRFGELSPQEKRILTGIEDTCCMMPKQIFNQFKFRNISFGEDIEIGIRFVESGYKTAFKFSTGVIHSHNRNSTYFFKRFFIDTLIVDSLLNMVPKQTGDNASLRDLVEQILGLYLRIKKSRRVPETISNAGIQTIESFKNSLGLTDIISIDPLYFSDLGLLKGTDSPDSLESLLSDCARLANAQSFRTECKLIQSYCAVLDDFTEYCSGYASFEGREKELCESFDKLFALIAGSLLATYYCKRSDSQLLESELALKKLLSEGI